MSEPFTFDEINLMCIYNTGHPRRSDQALTDMRGHLEPDETGCWHSRIPCLPSLPP